MKKLVCVVFIGSCLLAHAETKPYISIYAGGSGLQETEYENLPTDYGSVSGDFKYDAGPVFGVAIGTSIADWPVRVEVEYSYRKSSCSVMKMSSPIIDEVDGDDTSLKAYVLMGNIYYDLAWVDSPVIPYVFAGLGALRADVSIARVGSDNATVLAGQLGIGAGWAITDHIVLDVKGRVMMSDDIDLSENAKLDSLIYAEVLAGVRFQF